MTQVGRRRGAITTAGWMIVCGLAAAGIGLALTAPSAAQAPGVIQSQDANKAGVIADLVECKRKDGVLSVKIRLRNTSNDAASMTLARGGNYDGWYLTAASKKYFVLKDTEGAALAYGASSKGDVYENIDKGGALNWWAKYPAPPAEVKTVSIYTPISGPFDDVKITDQ